MPLLLFDPSPLTRDDPEESPLIILNFFRRGTATVCFEYLGSNV